MDLNKLYQERLKTADEAVKVVQSGDMVVCGHGGSMPNELVEALVRQKDRLQGVRLFHILEAGVTCHLEPGVEKHIRHCSNYVQGTARDAINEGRADLLSVFFSEVPGLMKNELKPDVVFASLTPPDEHGYMSVGLSCDYMPAAFEEAKVIIGLVNDRLPRTFGDTFIHISRLHAIVETSREPISSKTIEISEVERRIGQHCASLIHDGDTLQMGIGGIPDAVLDALKDKRDLGVHTEMLTDGLLKLLQSGVINNQKKTIDRGKTVGSFMVGSRALYDYCHNNPLVELKTVDYTNSIRTLMQIDNLVSINGCVEVDLWGQVASETIAGKHYSGVGGQVDFVRGAAASKNGRSILAMPSTAKKGAISRIVPALSPGMAVTTSRNDVDYVVTENGIAKLKGKTLKDRAKALIQIAHKDFQPELCAVYEARYHEALSL